ncbi:DUF5317 family protein [Alicyclobacillus mengziensis]|uniref:DUF5317 domain-containing protein n=1 Tax=Alicyclobacillus mengziensis TaxID=2931921 RepID=A0A9X7VZV5_9BACL|nr:DUF5317 family protein [Alicyclobacillus mengziensis]QSO48133.1 DUF5317 domain-containing protein [Alicyclobacillus mengziensis]
MAFQVMIILGGLVVGWLKRGNLWNIGNLKLNIWWILPVAYVLQHISVAYLSGRAYEIVIVASYILMLTFGALNFKYPGIIWSFVGTLSNFVALLFNGLRMPAYVPAVKLMAPEILPQLEAGTYGKSIAMSSTTHLNFLGDIFGFNVYPPSLLSIGDLLFAIGLVVLIQHAMAGDGKGQVVHD